MEAYSFLIKPPHPGEHDTHAHVSVKKHDAVQERHP